MSKEVRALGAQMPVEFQEEQQFRMLARSPDGDEPSWFMVTGAVCGVFGVFRFDDATGQGWSVTHLPSGRRIFAAVTEGAARAIVEQLLATEIAWDQPQFSEGETSQITKHISDQLLPEFVGKGWIR